MEGWAAPSRRSPRNPTPERYPLTFLPRYSVPFGCHGDVRLRPLRSDSVHFEPCTRGDENARQHAEVTRGHKNFEWWPQRDSNPCFHIAARFCQRINDLGRVESTSIGRGQQSSPRAKLSGATRSSRKVRLVHACG